MSLIILLRLFSQQRYSGIIAYITVAYNMVLALLSMRSKPNVVGLAGRSSADA